METNLERQHQHPVYDDIEKDKDISIAPSTSELIFKLPEN
ncbi:hypothetical protein DDB_G0268262 [Dictyostelium discoideum AX4]|uniref:Uncharacterized protein n=1 Tax=Dictyostelium discoideum TaxID=44689 RepID=Q55GW3_DICDI|nr:hypothetical protein DDB_G0268262 [Dictyostelium discoideum AX4]EAL73584.1 hypothetical protein DDB_G0268262 [Dictyostelium discoideum AX4]|eukprot:XP_647071.1 hypothetical protein DDB_G0268262 [Dictyostelium discoideum AX4]